MAEPDEQPKKERRRRFSILPRGTRVDDPAELHGWDAVRFRLALAARKYPVQIAMVIMLLIVSYPVWLLVTSSNALNTSQKELKRAVVATQTSRQVSSRAFCNAIRSNSVGLNSQIDFIVSQVEQSAADGEEQTAAEQAATTEFVSGLKANKVAPLDCDKFAKQIEDDVATLQKAGGG